MPSRAIVTTALLMSATVVATVLTPTAAADELVQDHIRVRMDGSATIDIHANDDLEPDLNRTTTIVAEPAHGTATIHAGAVTYKPDPGYTGTDEIFLRTTYDPAVLGAHAIAVLVTVVDKGVVTAPDVARVDHGGQVTVDIGQNDWTASGGPLRFTLYQTSGGQADCTATGVCTFTHDGTTRAGTLWYDAWDDTTGHHDDGRLDIVVKNRLPVANPDAVSAVRGSTVHFDVLDNDTDADADALTVRPVMGVDPLSCSPTGMCSFTVPRENDDVFPQTYSYRAYDGKRSALGEVTVDLAPNAPPEAEDFGIQVRGRDLVQIAPSFSEPNGDPWSLSLVTPPADGRVYEVGGEWHFQANRNATYSDAFTMRASDDLGASAEFTVTANIEEHVGPVLTDLRAPSYVQAGGTATASFLTDGLWRDDVHQLQTKIDGRWRTTYESPPSPYSGGSPTPATIYAELGPVKASGRYEIRGRWKPRYGATAATTSPRTVNIYDVDGRSLKVGKSESVTLTNTGKVAVNLRNWSLQGSTSDGRRSKQVRLPAYSLKAGRTVVIHVGAGTTGGDHLYLGLDSALFPNRSGRASLQATAKGYDNAVVFDRTY